MSAAALLLLALGLSGCEKDRYTHVNLGDGGGFDSVTPDLCPPCTITNNGVEICDYKDNDCDCQIDEEFNFNADTNNCGRCGFSCVLPGAVTACELGKCRYKGCAPGNYDHDLDMSKGWSATANGCEYKCTYTGVEKCDGQDNDCDRLTDEDFNLQNDVKNCGKCGVACVLANATAKCESGGCAILRCNPGYIDKNKTVADGCETPCTKTGTEICDGKDNDCNGTIDDVKTPGTPIDFKTDLDHCGGCNRPCLLPNAVVSCVAGNCTFSGCKSGFVDADKNPANGCECKPTTPSTETCDGKDNNCDGITDKDSGGVALKQVCYTGPPATRNKGICKTGTQTCSGGSWGKCVGEVVPKIEYCDKNDTDCDGTPDPSACVFSVSNAETKLDEPANTVLGDFNSTQLTVAGQGSQILAAWVDRRSGRSDIYANVSTNGGRTWLNKDVAVATEANNKLEPRVAFGGGSGAVQRAYIVYERFVPAGSSATPGLRDIYLARSSDGGRTWKGPPVTIKFSTPTNQSDALYVRMGVVPASGQDTVLICWERIAVSGAIRPNIYCRLSINSGKSFSADQAVNTTPNVAFGPDLAVDSKNGYVVWQEGQSIKVSKSPLSGSGLAFVSPTQLSGGAGQNPLIEADGFGLVVVAWEDLRDKQINIRANRSLNWGTQWLSSDVRVDLDYVDGDSTSPTIAIRQGGRVLVAWEDTMRGKRDIYVNWSDDSGATWNKPASRIPTNTAGTVTCGLPALAVDPFSKNVYAAWEDYRNGSYRDIYLSVSLDNGKTWNIPDYRMNESPAGKADAQRPVLWVSSARVAVLWQDNRARVSGSIGTGANADIYCSYVQ
jgi:hypothetical protein